MNLCKNLWCIVAMSLLATIGSFVAQYGLGLDPCVLCIVQRLLVMAVGCVALCVALAKQQSRIGRAISALLVSAPTVYGAGVAIYQMYLQPAAGHGAGVRRAVVFSPAQLAAV